MHVILTVRRGGTLLLVHQLLQQRARGAIGGQRQRCVPIPVSRCKICARAQQRLDDVVVPGGGGEMQARVTAVVDVRHTEAVLQEQPHHLQIALWKEGRGKRGTQGRIMHSQPRFTSTRTAAAKWLIMLGQYAHVATL